MNKDLSFQNNTGVQHATVNIFGRITTLTRRVVQTFEDTMVLNIPDSLLEQSLSRSSVYWKALPLRPGLYRLSLAVKDVNSGDTGTLELRLEVPQFLEDQLATSSLILADQIEKVPTKRVGTFSISRIPCWSSRSHGRPCIGKLFRCGRASTG